MNNTQIIQKLQSSNSRLFKEEVLLNEMNKDNDSFFEGLTLAYNRLLTFGVKKIPVALDDGPGIDKSQHDEVLQPFTRLDPSRNQNKGSGVGLGLPIAKEVAEGHGGFLKLSASSLLNGLCASIIIPVDN